MVMHALKQHKMKNIGLSMGLTMAMCMAVIPTAQAENGRLLATGGATQIEGAAGGGIVPWALISGYGTEDEIGGTAFLTNVRVPNYDLVSTGVAVGLYDRVELSYAHQRLNLDSTVLTGLGIGAISLNQDIFGAKVKVLGDAIFAQNSVLPQISVGMQYKRNTDYDFVPKAIGAASSSGTDFYVAATKVFLGGLAGRNILLNSTIRMSKANQMGLLGFGSSTDNNYHPTFEGSVGIFLDPANTWLIGAEYRGMHDNQLVGGALKQDAYKDAYVAYIPNKRFALVAAYADLGNLPDTTTPSLNSKKNGVYLSAQFSY